MKISDPDALAKQYESDANLRVRMETHALYGVGPDLEPGVDRELALRGDEGLLDVGCGPGDFVARLYRQGHRGRLVGIDSSPGMIARASAACPAVNFAVGNAENLAFAEGEFDVVTARHMLYHVADIPRALLEMRRVLRPGGRFLAVTNSANFMAEYRTALREAAENVNEKLGEGIAPMISTAWSSLFSDANGPDYVRAAFGNVRMTAIDSALRFEAAEPVLRYFDSCRSMTEVSHEAWASARESFGRVIEARLAGGPWMVSKRVVILTATRG